MGSIYKLELEKPAIKFINKHEKQIQKRVLDALEGLRENPPKGDIKRLQGEDLFRIRIGSMRALFSIDHQDKTITIKVIGDRGDIYPNSNKR